MLVEKLLKVALLGSSWVMWLLLVLSIFSIGAMIE
jgi:biopolymer transport protein ExbB/biopolymer transport protein TolQ